MRSADELKRQWLTQAARMFPRPRMWGRDGREMESQAHNLLHNLCFVDDRDDEYEQFRRRLDGYGKLGVHGPFTAIFDDNRRCVADTRRCVDEVASVYAEQFQRLGYLTVDRLLTQAEWTPLTGVRDWVADRDIRRSEVEATFGPPSLDIGNRVLCYAPEDGTGWVFVDCWTESAQRYVPGRGHYENVTEADALVRDIRVPAPSFEDGLILTRYGRVLRWGPGWWVHHSGHRTSDEQAAIAAQLRQIEADDPSQGRHRGPA